MPRKGLSVVEKLCGCHLADCGHTPVSAEKRAEYARQAGAIGAARLSRCGFVVGCVEAREKRGETQQVCNVHGLCRVGSCTEFRFPTPKADYRWTGDGEVVLDDQCGSGQPRRSCGYVSLPTSARKGEEATHRRNASGGARSSSIYTRRWRTPWSEMSHQHLRRYVPSMLLSAASECCEAEPLLPPFVEGRR